MRVCPRREKWFQDSVSSRAQAAVGDMPPAAAAFAKLVVPRLDGTVQVKMVLERRVPRPKATLVTSKYTAKAWLSREAAHDRVRELNTWSQIKGELKDGSFDDENVNSHQAESYKLALTNRVKSLGPNAGPAEVVNAVGPLQTIERLKTQDGKLLDFKEAKLQLNQGKPEQPQQ